MFGLASFCLCFGFAFLLCCVFSFCYVDKILHEGCLIWARKKMWQNRKSLYDICNILLTLCPSSLSWLHPLVDDVPTKNTIPTLGNPCVEP